MGTGQSRRMAVMKEHGGDRAEQEDGRDTKETKEVLVPVSSGSTF